MFWKLFRKLPAVKMPAVKMFWKCSGNYIKYASTNTVFSTSFATYIARIAWHCNPYRWYGNDPEMVQNTIILPIRWPSRLPPYKFMFRSLRLQSGHLACSRIRRYDKDLFCMFWNARVCTLDAKISGFPTLDRLYNIVKLPIARPWRPVCHFHMLYIGVCLSKIMLE